MTTAKWGAPEAATTILGSGLNSLADGAYSALGTEVDNETDRYLYGNFELNLASLSPTTGAYVALYLVPSVDGTNYPDVSNTRPPGEEYRVGTFTIDTTATSTSLHTATNILIPPFKFKCMVLNECNVALNATGNSVDIRRHNTVSVA